MQQQQQQEPIATLLYRIDQMEKDVVQLKAQLNLYVPARENDLRMQSINDTVGRIENELIKVKDKLEGMNTHMIASEQDAQKRDASQRESQDKLQIKVLWFLVSFVLGIISLVLVAYFTHFF